MGFYGVWGCITPIPENQTDTKLKKSWKLDLYTGAIRVCYFGLEGLGVKLYVLGFR